MTLVKMLVFWRTNSTKHTKILHFENFVLTNMNIVCYSLCMDFGLRQNARRTAPDRKKEDVAQPPERATSRSSGLRTGKLYPLKL